MREILFKAKGTTTGKWYEGFLVALNEDCCHIKDDKGAVYYCNINTICQYTGLTDKNGNKIWENDVLFDGEYKSLVRWDESVARFVIDDYGTEGCVMEYGFDEDAGDYGVVDTNGFDDFCDDSHMIFETIGNIFDNPELLGV